MAEADTPVLVLDAFGACRCEEHSSDLQFLQGYVGALVEEFRPSQIVFVTSSELFPFSVVELEELIRSVDRDCHGAGCKILSQACVGFHAFLLDLATSDVGDALAIFLELPAAINQHCLDAIGAGAGGDDLQVQECYGFAYCTKRDLTEVAPDAVIVQTTHLLRQPTKINGTLHLAKRVTELMRSFSASRELRVVAFDTHSRWSRQLKTSFSFWLGREELPTIWLPSCEIDKRHFSTLKPLFELERYRHELAEGPIVLITLGAAGRIGATVVTRGSDIRHDHLAPTKISRKILSFSEELCTVREVCVEFEQRHDVVIFHAAIRDHMRYPRRDEPNHDNTIYIWDLSRTLDEPRRPSTKNDTARSAQ